MVDEDMPEVDRFALLFERGKPVQRLAAIRNLPALIAQHGKSTATPNPRVWSSRRRDRVACTMLADSPLSRAVPRAWSPQRVTP